MTIKTRLTKLEKWREAMPHNAPQIIETWGTREDGTRYLLDRLVRDESGKYIEVQNEHSEQTKTA